MPDKIRVGITGQGGFIGSHLYQFLKLQKDIEAVPFERTFFDSDAELRGFVSSCDALVHLAGLSRHANQRLLYDTNMGLTQKLINALEAGKSRPHLIFGSTAHEDRDSLYHASKRDGRRLFDEWAARGGAKSTGLLMPNVFGPFGRPDHNSVVSTFCHRAANGLEPEIKAGSKVRLIYISDLCREILRVIKGEVKENPFTPPYGAEKSVSEIAAALQRFRKIYFGKGVFPSQHDKFERDLFATLMTYADMKKFYPLKIKTHRDSRGCFAETANIESGGGAVSFSVSAPGVSRGNHFHTRKIERYTVIGGKALVRLRRIGSTELVEFELSGDEPASVDIPVWHAHSIKNIGSGDMTALFWNNEIYDPADTDAFPESPER